MLSTRTRELIHGFSPAVAVAAYGVLTLDATVDRMLQTHARRYRQGEEYAPHNHALAVVKGWTEALLDDGSQPQPAAGYAQHERTGVNARPDLLYMVGAMLTTFWVQRASENGVISQGTMAEIEHAFFRASYAYSVGVELIDNVSWPSHQAAVTGFMKTVGNTRAPDSPSYAHAVHFWRDIVMPIGGEELRAAVGDVFINMPLIPRHLTDLFVGAEAVR